MRNVNFNDFKKKGILFEIGDKSIKVQFIPYPIEKEIYSNITKLETQLLNPMGMDEDEIERMKYWVTEIFKHKNNNNEVDSDFVDNEMGVTEIFSVVIALMNFVADRVTNMYEQLDLQNKGTGVSP